MRHGEGVRFVRNAAFAQFGNDAGLQQRGLARSAGPEDEHQATFVLELSPQHCDQVASRLVSPPEDIGLRAVERVQTDVWIACPHARSGFRNGRWCAGA